MLVLTRRNGEGVVIQLPGREEIRVVVWHHSRNHQQIKVGITAPDHVAILREELLKNEEADAQA